MWCTEEATCARHSPLSLPSRTPPPPSPFCGSAVTHLPCVEAGSQPPPAAGSSLPAPVPVAALPALSHPPPARPRLLVRESLEIQLVYRFVSDGLSLSSDTAPPHQRKHWHAFVSGPFHFSSIAVSSPSLTLSTTPEAPLAALRAYLFQLYGHVLSTAMQDMDVVPSACAELSLEVAAQ